MNQAARQVDTTLMASNRADVVNRFLQVLAGLDPWYGRLLRMAARICGAVFVSMGGLAIALGYAGFLRTADPLPHRSEAGQLFTIGAAMAVLGVGWWWVASGEPWRVFDRLMEHPLVRRDGEFSQGWQVVTWWESRRPAYNLIVGIAGLVSVAIMVSASRISASIGGAPAVMPHDMFLVFLSLVFGIGANFCYTGGWIVELMLRGVTGADMRGPAPWAFASGLALSVGVALLPALFAVTYLLVVATGALHLIPGAK
jgi:hypothetical protein